MIEKLIYAVAIGIIVLAWMFMAYQANECEEAGGTLVRGVFAFECIGINDTK